MSQDGFESLGLVGFKPPPEPGPGESIRLPGGHRPEAVSRLHRGTCPSRIRPLEGLAISESGTYLHGWFLLGFPPVINRRRKETSQHGWWFLGLCCSEKPTPTNLSPCSASKSKDERASGCARALIFRGQDATSRSERVPELCSPRSVTQMRGGGGGGGNGTGTGWLLPR